MGIRNTESLRVGSDQLTEAQKLVERLEFSAEDGAEDLQKLLDELEKDPEYAFAAIAARETVKQFSKTAASCGILFNVLSMAERNKRGR